MKLELVLVAINGGLLAVAGVSVMDKPWTSIALYVFFSVSMMIVGANAKK